MVQSVSCCHNLDLAIFILNLRNVLVDEIPDRITKSQLKQTNLRRIRVLIIWLASWVGKMNQIVPCDWLPKWARWTKSSPVIGYPSGQDEPNRPLWLVTWVGKMNQILQCDWLPEWARWTKSSPVIGYLSGQDEPNPPLIGYLSGQDEPNPPLWLVTRVGKMTLSCPLRTTHWVPQEKFSWKPYLNKSFIDQACSVKMDISLVHFLRVYGPWLCLHP